MLKGERKARKFEYMEGLRGKPPSSSACLVLDRGGLFYSCLWFLSVKYSYAQFNTSIGHHLAELS